MVKQTDIRKIAFVTGPAKIGSIAYGRKHGQEA